MATCPKYMQVNTTRSLVMSHTKVVMVPSLCFHTTQTHNLRKAPKTSWKIFGIQWAYLPWPSYFIKAIIRRRMKPEVLGPDEAHRKSIFHRLSLLYVLLAWTGAGVGIWVMSRPKTQDEVDEEKRIKALPYQDEIDKGGAMWWINALKTPDDMQDMKKLQIIKFSGFSYKGTEDVTVKAKEIGQERNRRDREMVEESDDYFLRKRMDIKLEKDGGPTNQQLREQYKAEGKDYELELDFSNLKYKKRTNYNADGTVGSYSTKEDFKMGKIVPEDKELDLEMEMAL